MAVHAPDVRAGLAPPATEAALSEAELELGVSLPAELRASFLEHDGEARDVGCIEGLHLNTLEEALVDWRAMNELLESGAFEPLPTLDPSNFEATAALMRQIEARALGKVSAAPTEQSPRHAGLRGGHWRRGWFPFASTGGGDSLCVDLDPGAGGVFGQVFFFDHEEGPSPVRAPGLRAWLQSYVDELEAGRRSVRGPAR